MQNKLFSHKGFTAKVFTCFLLQLTNLMKEKNNLLVDVYIYLKQTFFGRRIEKKRRLAIIYGITWFVESVIEKTGDKILGERTLKVAEYELPKYLGMKEDDLIKRLEEIVKTEKNKLKKQREEEKEKKDRFVKELDKKVSSVNESWLKFAREKDYLITPLKEYLKTEINNSFNLIKKRPKLMEQDERFEQEIKKNQARLNNLESQIQGYNEKFIEKMKVACADIFKKATFELNEQQINATIKDDKHNLVVAGAGSGKTEVLTNRIAYLVKKPNGVDRDILPALKGGASLNEVLDVQLVDVPLSSHICSSCF